MSLHPVSVPVITESSERSKTSNEIITVANKPFLLTMPALNDIGEFQPRKLRIPLAYWHHLAWDTVFKGATECESS